MRTIRTVGVRGAGLSGLTIARELLRLEPGISITVFDLRPRLPHPQRTFCFFDTTHDWRPPCSTVTWPSVTFRGPSFERRLDVQETPYTMIRGDDFFESVLQELETSGVSFHWGLASVQIEDNTIVVAGERHTYDCVIDAAFQPATASSLLWQSFAGVWIETHRPVFDSTTAIVMDLQLSSAEIPVSFLYILPTSRTSALIEHTTFSPTPLSQEYHTQRCSAWIRSRIGHDVSILTNERGAIPMGLATPTPLARYVVGSSAGAVRPATGYAFLATQRHARLLSNQILRGETHRRPLYPWWLVAGDALFLRALKYAPHEGATLLEQLLARSPAHALVAFISGDTTPAQALSVWLSVPKLAMLRSLIGGAALGLLLVPALFFVMIVCALVTPTAAEWLALTLMIVAGIPHGSFDLRVAQTKWRVAAESPVRTVVYYLVCVVIMSALCVFTPLLGLACFLVISCLHFTEGESYLDSPGDAFRSALVGISAIVLPIGLHPDEAASYVNYFVSHDLFSVLRRPLEHTASFVALALGVVLINDLVKKRTVTTTIERALCLLAWILLPPLAGFSVWFIGRHSRQHLALCHTMFSSPANSIPLDFLLISLLAILGLSPFMLMFDFSDINQLFAAAICLIAGLTLPHMIVSHGLIRRERKSS